MSDLPALCRHGQNGFEKKLLLYLDAKPRHRHELRYPDSTEYGETDLPSTLVGEYTFIPIYEISQRILLFQFKVDKEKVFRHLMGLNKKQPARKKRKKKNDRIKRTKQKR